MRSTGTKNSSYLGIVIVRLSFRYSRLSMIRQTSRKYASAWEQRKLGDVTDSFSGGTPDVSHTSSCGGSFRLSGPLKLTQTRRLFLTEKGLDNSSAKIVEHGTVLYALYGATSGEVRNRCNKRRDQSGDTRYLPSYGE